MLSSFDILQFLINEKLHGSFFILELYAISDSEHYKSQALRNAKEAYQIHQERVSRCSHSLRDELIIHTHTHSHSVENNPQISRRRRGCLMRRRRTAAALRYTRPAAHPRAPALALERATASPTRPSTRVKTFLSPPSSTANSKATS